MPIAKEYNETLEILKQEQQATFALANAEEVEPEADELEALAAYASGDPEYTTCISQEELIKELGL